MLKLGFIGLGNMGHHMVNHLIEKGYQMVIYDINSKATEPYQQTGVIIAESPLEVANHAEIVMASLPSPEISRDVVLNTNGLINGTSIKTYIDLSTTGYTASCGIAKELDARGIKTLDSPVSGGVLGAKNGTLTVMVSGEKDIFEECKDVFQTIGKSVFYIGENIGQAQIMKLANNMLSAAAMTVTSEAMVLGVKAGIDPNVMLDVINLSTGRNTATVDKFPKSVLPRSFDFGFKTSLFYKDIKLCLDVAESIGVPMWVGSSIKQYWNFVISQGGGDEDFTHIVKYIEQWAGVEVVSTQ
jgi:2-hydroxy-3-oxopropionate reductase